MSSPTGISGYPVHPRRIEKRNPAEVASAAYQAAKTGVGQRQSLPSPRFGGAIDSVAGGISRLGMPEWVQNVFLFTSKEGASAVYPLEAAVVAGRTQSAYKRDGWMEVQERVFEEIAAAVIWLKGVDFLKNGFKKGQNQFLPKYNHLNPDIAWNRPWGKVKSVDLTAQELFAKDRGEVSSLLRLKSARWVFSVGLALAGVAYVVPTLNQLKTKAIMGYQISRRKRSQEGDNVQFGDPKTASRIALGGHSTIGGTFGQIASPASSLQSALNHFPFKSSIQLPSGSNPYQPVQFGAESQNRRINPAFGSDYSNLKSSKWPFHKGQSNQAGKNVQFGGMPGGSLVEGLGHLVDQTAYGSILVVDAGIAGGRSYVASKRSAFETVEVLVRDIGSLYFYILSVPHIMKALGATFDAGFKTSVNLEPKIAQEMNDRIKALLKPSGTQSPLSKLKAALHGSSANGLLLPEGWLKTGIRTADPDKLADLLALEARVYLGDHQAKPFIAKVRNAGAIMPAKVQEWLEEIANGNGLFKTLNNGDRKNLGVALKQAFRHTVGLEVSGLKGLDALPLITELEKNSPGFTEALKSMGFEEAKAYSQRIWQMAEVDGLNQAHSLFRRTVNLLRDKAKDDPDLFKQADKLADWLDNAQSRHLTLAQLTELESKVALHKTGRSEIKTVMGQLVDLAEKSRMGNEHALLKEYEAQLKKLMNGDTGRLFSLAIDQGDESLAQKLREMLQGGLHNDTAFLREAQSIVSQFKPDSREFTDPAKAAQMREAIGKYGDALLGKLKSLGENATREALEANMDGFLKLNRNLNYASRSVAMLGTMACLGWLVPHVQTTITKRLTGKDKNPGIASTASSLGYGKETQKDEPANIAQARGNKGSSAAPPLKPDANGLFVGQMPRRYYPSLGQASYQS